MLTGCTHTFNSLSFFLSRNNRCILRSDDRYHLSCVFNCEGMNKCPEVLEAEEFTLLLPRQQITLLRSSSEKASVRCMQNHALTVRESLRTHARCLGIKAKRFNCHMLLHQICALKNQRDRFFSSLWVLNRWLIPFGCKGGFLMQGVQRHHVLNGLFTPHSLTISSLME